MLIMSPETRLKWGKTRSKHAVAGFMCLLVGELRVLLLPQFESPPISAMLLSGRGAKEGKEGYKMCPNLQMKQQKLV